VNVQTADGILVSRFGTEKRLTKRPKYILIPEYRGKLHHENWELSEILRQKLLEEGVSYRELSQKTGVPVNSLWIFLNRRGGLNLASIEKLMKRYGLAVIELHPRKSKGRKHGKRER
jgi:hypothetical protein